MSSREDIAWAAGLFEGEGCFSIHKPNATQPNARCVALVSMTDKDVMERFIAVVGIGKLLGPYHHSRGGKNKPHWNWHISGFEDVQMLLAAFWPWLGARRRARAVEVLSQTPLVQRRPRRALN